MAAAVAIPRLATAEECAAIKTLIGYSPELAIWVNRFTGRRANEKSVQPRLLVLCRYHVFYLKKGSMFSTKFKVQKAAHLYDLAALSFIKPASKPAVKGSRSASSSAAPSLAGVVGKWLFLPSSSSSASATVPPASQNDAAAAERGDKIVNTGSNVASSGGRGSGGGGSQDDDVAGGGNASRPLRIDFKGFRVILENHDRGLGELLESYLLAQATTMGLGRA
eukprot:CAMPEP_0171757730 /NCGR_PEP_ID=MMETSP0991-20121206/45844_1 /TAXON_ID=483369 /ORGANISM="non described non described, Strain CCMP2098" /LENGTH=221 /DNA_ID=CAMNT_0012360277 /DNA_START=58 /DNA_END=721 /DNA_ORIENTATION=+